VGPGTILYWLEREGIVPLPGRTSVERCLIRHGLVTPQARKRKRADSFDRVRDAYEAIAGDHVGKIVIAVP
jgi:hypothetical protein